MSPLVYGDTTSEKAIAAFGDIGGSILNGVAALNNFFHWGVGRLGGSDQDADALLLASGLPEANLGGAMDGTAGLLGALKGSSKCENVARGGTYLLRDAETGQVMRTGRTSDLARRAAEHGLDPLLRDFEFEPVHRTDVYNEQRGLEQLLHDMYQPPLNKIRPISPANPNLLIYQDAANGFPGNP
jgi:hypothetical protein